MDIPIVLFHKSEKYYVSCALRSAKAFNKDVTIITDVTTKLYGDYAKVVDYTQYNNESAAHFSTIYQHFSSNSYVFEYTAIEKYFFLLEHMKKNKLDKIIYIDSDILIYENLTALIEEQYQQYDFSCCTHEQTYEDMKWTSSGHTIVCTYQALEQFCAFIIKTYTNNVEELLKKWHWHQENKMPGGICDMTLLYLFQKNSSLKFGNLLSVVNETVCFDHHISNGWNEYQDEYETEYSFLLDKMIKKIIFIDGRPFGYNRRIGKNIRFATLHCQGGAKKIMQLLVKDKKSLKNTLSDYKETLPWVYRGVRRELSKKIRRWMN